MTYRKVSTMTEALHLAKETLSRRPRTYFRGQRQNWPVRSTLERLDEIGRQEAIRKLAHFSDWIATIPELSEFSRDQDSVIGVAQHYGIPTTFVDFSKSPEVACYFATEAFDVSSNDQEAYILVLDVDEYYEFWSRLPQRYKPPQLIEVEIANLWRLEAQQGLFLECHTGNIEKVFDLDRIVFPAHTALGLLAREMIYPTRKSSLELRLDQFFFVDTLRANEQTAVFKEFTHSSSMVEFTPSKIDPDLFPSGLPVHHSWTGQSYIQWKAKNLETFERISEYEYTSIAIQLAIADLSRLQLALAIAKSIEKVPDNKLRFIHFEVICEGASNDASTLLREISDQLAELWDGLRQTPAPVYLIAFAAALLVIGHLRIDARSPAFRSRDLKTAINDLVPNPKELELATQGDAYSRCIGSLSWLYKCVRGDLAEFIAERYRSDLHENPIGLLFGVPDPQRLFDFSEFSVQFIADCVPTQFLLNRSGVVFSPGQLVSFGLP
jgi:FRG domain